MATPINPVNPVNPMGYLLNELKAAFTPAPIEQHTETYSNGDTYTGGWRNNKREGTGELTCTNGELYVGEWKNDKRHGKGRRKWFVEEEPSRYKATRKWDGYIYDGQWKDDQRHGEGTELWYYHKIADWNAGWNNDEGNAPINTSSHDGYTGEWKNDRMHGLGTRIYHREHSAGHEDYGDYKEWNETIIYYGGWKKGMRHGNGKQTVSYSDGRKDWVWSDREWENDSPRREREYKYMSHDEMLYGRGGGGGGM